MELYVDFNFVCSKHSTYSVQICLTTFCVTPQVPPLYPTLIQTQEDWSYKALPSKKACQGMQKKECRLTRGKVLGGTSTIGNLHYHRGNRRDFLVWEEISDNTWSPATAITHYKRIERDLSPSDFSIDYGTSGEIHLNNLKALSCVRTAIFNSSKVMGYDRMQMGDSLGYVESLLTVDGGARQNSAKAFLSPVRNRKNLKLILGAQVTRVNFTRPPDLKAQVVEVLYKKRKYGVKALKEIILTAGAINTPKILMSSGIGAKEHLKELRIPLIADKKVGYNLQDHFRALVLASINVVDAKGKAPDRAFEYIMHKSGWLSKINVHDVVGYINTFQAPHDNPNVAIYHYFFEKNDDLLQDFFKKLGYTDKIVKSIVRHNKENAILAFMPTLLKPKSRGRVLLKSSDPLDDPIIQANYLGDEMEEDLETLASGVRYVMKSIDSPDFVMMEAKLLNIDIPNCKSMKLWSEPYIRCIVKNTGFPGSQLVGTVKMASCCEEGIVGSTLEVKGVRGLRVVDGSVMPEPPSANIQATLAMMADRTAEIVKEKWIKGYRGVSSSGAPQQCNACVSI